MSFKAMHGPLIFRKIFNSKFHKKKIEIEIGTIFNSCWERRKCKKFRIHGDPKAQAMPPM
jgi:hypothetical protein